jgi:hypothetical protein
MIYTKNNRLTTTVPKPMVQLPNGFTGLVSSILVSNSGSGANTITLDVATGAEEDDYTLLSNKEVPEDDFFLLDFNTGIVLQPEDVVTVTAGSSGVLDVLVTLDLTYSPLSTNRLGSGA